MTFKFGKEELKEFEEIFSYAEIIETHLDQGTIKNLPTGYGPAFEVKAKMAELFKDFAPTQEEDWKIFANNLEKMFLIIESYNGFKKPSLKKDPLPFLTKFVEETFFNYGSNAPLSYFMGAIREAQTSNLVNLEVGNTRHVPLNRAYRPAASSQLKKIEEETQNLLRRVEIQKQKYIGGEQKGTYNGRTATIATLLAAIKAVEVGSFIEHSKKVKFKDTPEVKEISIVGKGRKCHKDCAAISSSSSTKGIKDNANKSPLRLGVGVSAGSLSVLLVVAAIFYSLKENENNIKLVRTLSASLIICLCTAVYTIGTYLKGPKIQEQVPQASNRSRNSH